MLVYLVCCPYGPPAAVLIAKKPLIWVTSRPAQIAIATAAMILDMVRFDLVGLYIYGHVHHARNKRAMAERGEKVEPTPFYRMSPLPKTMRVPAMNIEHAIDRNADFVVIVLGELVYVYLSESRGKSSDGQSQSTFQGRSWYPGCLTSVWSSCLGVDDCLGFELSVSAAYS